ncbi:MAG: formimidoylglutamate deiminase [Myxococcales bacterium]|nr:formimidoylglutamate deiminase [Myxococcales bacterium]
MEAAAEGARVYAAAAAVIDGELALAPAIEVASDGTIAAIHRDPSTIPAALPRYELGRRLLLPGLVNAHSHAFQRMIRGATHRRRAGDPSDFWSWREAMYAAAQGLDPAGVYRATRACFAEMVRAGITCVGEFHYLHHQVDGRPYDDPNELSRQVIQAAADVGIRLVLLEVFYARAGAHSPPLPEQRRFCDGSIDAYLARVDALRGEGVSLGLAPHSVRAAPADALREIAAYARAHGLVIHAHVSEQPRENEECAAEHGRTPTAVFAEAGCLDRPRTFTAVHAVHVDDGDLRRLGGQHVCACPTTEADLGDGIVPALDHRLRGARLALGSDSNAIIDLFQEARLLEMDERLRIGARICLAGPDESLGLALLRAATVDGASALGRPELGRLGVGAPFDAICVDLDHPTLADVGVDAWLDAVMLTGTAALVDQVYVGGVRRR